MAKIKRSKQSNLLGAHRKIWLLGRFRIHHVPPARPASLTCNGLAPRLHLHALPVGPPVLQPCLAATIRQPGKSLECTRRMQHQRFSLNLALQATQRGDTPRQAAPSCPRARVAPSIPRNSHSLMRKQKKQPLFFCQF